MTPTRKLLSVLTPMERQIAEALATGKNPKQIATELHRSTETIRGQLKSCYSKLGVHSQLQLALMVLAYRNMDDPTNSD
jgi:DNA-binding NarL/FixJ family response regulator